MNNTQGAVIGWIALLLFLPLAGLVVLLFIYYYITTTTKEKGSNSWSMSGI